MILKKPTDRSTIPANSSQPERSAPYACVDTQYLPVFDLARSRPASFAWRASTSSKVVDDAKRVALPRNRAGHLPRVGRYSIDLFGSRAARPLVGGRLRWWVQATFVARSGESRPGLWHT